MARQQWGEVSCASVNWLRPRLGASVAVHSPRAACASRAFAVISDSRLASLTLEKVEWDP